jgi:adenylate cyclase
MEAERNERMTLAAGSLAGEQRVAIARLAMIAMFGFVMEILPRLQGEPHPFDALRVAVGLFYSFFSIGTLIAVHRVKPNPRDAIVRTALLTLLDFAFIGFQSVRDVVTGLGTMHPELFGVAGSILISFAIVRPTIWHVVLSVGLAIATFLACAFYDGHVAVRTMFFLPAGFLALGVLVALTNRAMRAMFKDLRRRDNLTRFLPQPVAERMLSIGPEALAPVQREVTVLFSDIRGFTSLSETLAPRDVLELLDDYFGRMSQIVKGHDGVVGKFIGDGLLAFWGVPDRDPDHAAKAVRAALDMLRALDELNRDREVPLRIGVGVHTGPVAAGMLGGAEHSEYTVIGDAVNVASRIEGKTKELGVAILVSETTWGSCGDRFEGKRLEAEEIRGRREPVVLFAIGPSSGSQSEPQ